ncbi:MAG: M50 family metallopeptidase [Candidatus Promineifilaceae bacterium]|nr:M50 family metallopeptidase [Candidatus Promineifilaceae bacterium]
MEFFQRLFGDPISLIFTLISLAYFVRGLGLAREGWRRRDELGQEPLTPWKKQWAERAAFYVAVPPGVLIHELGHAAAVWLFGGRVAEFGFGFYWGYVLPAGSFTAPEDWFISLAGTLGTLVYALVLWLILRRSKHSPWRYTGLRTLRFHFYYALVYYPVFTLITFIGDWRTIYNFDATPVLSGVTLATHLSALGAFWWTDRQGWYEMPTFRSAEEQAELSDLREQAARLPHDHGLQLRLIDALRRSGAHKEAQEQLRAFLADNPHSAEGHLIMAALESEQNRFSPKSVEKHAERALQLGLPGPTNAAYAHSLLGQHYLQREREEEAIRQLNQAINMIEKAVGPAGEPAPHQQNVAHLYYLRALAHRRQGRYEAAYQDVQKAIDRAGGAGQAPDLYENERKTIERQAERL